MTNGNGIQSMGMIADQTSLPDRDLANAWTAIKVSDQLRERLLAQSMLALQLGAVARFNSSASRAGFPTPRSRHHGVGLRPAELGHPDEDRGRDAGRPAPPAQIRARAPNAHGSYLG